LKSPINKFLDCDICKASENLLMEYKKNQKEGRKNNEDITNILFPSEKKQDIRKENLENFKIKRDKYKIIIVNILFNK